MRGILVVFAKRPEPGGVKTRLCPPFTPGQAAELYACMLDDVLESSSGDAAQLGLALGLAVHPPDAVEALAARAPQGTWSFAQRGADLGERMAAAVEDAHAAGFAPVLLRGSDSPTLGLDALRAAVEALSRADGVIGPDRDGGYNLIGLRRPVPGLFAHAMSTGRVLEDTRARACAKGLAVELLPHGFDIDTAGDLALLAHARRAGEASRCPRTLAWLDAHDAWCGQEPRSLPSS